MKLLTPSGYSLSARWNVLSSTRWPRLRLRRQISSALGDSPASSSEKSIHLHRDFVYRVFAYPHFRFPARPRIAPSALTDNFRFPGVLLAQVRPRRIRPVADWN